MKKMIRNITWTIALLFMFSMSSCDFFKEPIGENINEEVVFKNMYNAERAIFDAYRLLPYRWPCDQGKGDYENKSIAGGDIIASLCDEAVAGSNSSGATTSHYGEGNISARNQSNMEFRFDYPYHFIRLAQIFLNGLPLVGDATPEWTAKVTGEANLLKAIGFWELLRRYGSVPYVDEVFMNPQTVRMERLPLKKFVEKVDSLITTSLNGLPDVIDQGSVEYGRVTKGTALFLRGRMWLTLASPLFNTSTPYMTYDHPELICMMPDNPKALWEKAVKYNKEAIDFMESHGYKMIDTGNPEADYTTATRDLKGNTEIITFSRRTNASQPFRASNQLTSNHNPPSILGSSGQNAGHTCPTQNLVDMYLVKVDENTSRVQTPEDYMNACPWENMELDPRFYASIIYDGAKFGTDDEKIQILTQDHDKYITTDGGHGFITGYYLKKFLFGSIFIDEKVMEDIPYPYMRLPELYLNYAEALNEVQPGHADIEIYLNKTIQRVDMPWISLAGKGQEEVRQVIRRERAVEFALEDQRYFDVKRWLIADQTIGGTKYSIVRNGGFGDPATTYTKAPTRETRQTVWKPEKYLMPFPHTEILKDRGLIQNPGW